MVVAVASGYCKRCDRLVSIEPKEHKGGDERTRNWYPVAHVWAEHVGCCGSVIEGSCTRCDKPVTESEIATAACPGTKRPI